MLAINDVNSDECFQKHSDEGEEDYVESRLEDSELNKKYLMMTVNIRITQIPSTLVKTAQEL